MKVAGVLELGALGAGIAWCAGQRCHLGLGVRPLAQQRSTGGIGVAGEVSNSTFWLLAFDREVQLTSLGKGWLWFSP